MSEILERRLSTADAPPAIGPVISIAAHAAFLAVLILVSRPRVVTVLPVALPVRVISPAALGGRSVAPARPAPAPTPAPAAPQKPKRVIEKLNEKPVPSAKAMPEPTARKKKMTPTPAPAAAAPSEPSVELPSAGGSGSATEGSGSALSFGTSVAGLDSDFPFTFYVDQMLTLIGGNWLKPEGSEGLAAVVGFQIQRDGQITDVKLLTPSGVGFYDRAAVRAVYAANPLPPLPPEFQGDRLGVHLRFR
ncbi:MAG: TonB family protein [Acidithiobacillales bacterium]